VTPTSPAPRAAAAVAPPSITTVGTNDEAVVRQAIDRFLATYNARLVSHGELGRSGFLKLQSCRVDLSDQAAAAACHASFASSADPEVRVWTFALGRTGTGWAIRSIAFD
jgi:hypothetical protein